MGLKIRLNKGLSRIKDLYSEGVLMPFEQLINKQKTLFEYLQITTHNQVLSHPCHLEEKVEAKASGLSFRGEDVFVLIPKAAECDVPIPGCVFYTFFQNVLQKAKGKETCQFCLQA